MKDEIQSQSRRRAIRSVVISVVTITTLAVLAYLVIPIVNGDPVVARTSAAKAQMASFKSALERFNIDNGYYPRDLQALIQRPPQSTNWHGPYLDSDAVPVDSWGRHYIYTCPGVHGPGPYDLLSGGPDGVVGTRDDITSW